MSFSQLKANRNKTLEALEKKLNDTGGAPAADPTFWQPTRDSAGNGSAIIRFLPPTEGEDLPFVKLWTHAFKGPTGKWYIENSLTTIGKPDPVSEHNQKLWATELPDNKKLASARKRKLNYISNIYVVKDPAKPENDGKVFKFKYGQKIMDMIKAAHKPEFDDQEPVVPFDFWEGANFRLRIKKDGNFPNYDASTFDKAGPLFESDEDIERVWNQQYPLLPLIADSEFKSYEELKKRFYDVIAEAAGADAAALDDEEPRRAAPKQAKAAPKQAPKVETTVVDDGDDDWLAGLENLDIE